MKKILNFRILFFCFISFSLAITFAWEFWNLSIIHIVFFAFALLFLIFFAIKRGKILNLLAVLTSFLIGIFAFAIDYKLLESDIFLGEKTIVGRVSVFKNYEKYQKIILTDVKVEGMEKANITLTVIGGTLLQGEIIEFKSEIETISFFNLGNFASQNYKNNSPYASTITFEDIISSHQSELSFAETIRFKIRNLLHNFMPSETAELAYSALFGDRSNLDSEITQSFTQSGIAHIIAVSGLNTAILVALLYFLLKKLKLKPYLILLIIGAFLIFYAYLCGFDAPVMRSSIMSVILLSASLFGRQYDIVNSLSLAGFIMLLFNPLQVFDVGFQLSFMCVFLIALFSTDFQRLLRKVKIPNFIASPLAMTICVQLGLLPLTAQYFGEISLLSVFTNLICVPLFEIGFILTFALIPFIFLMPFLGYLLIVPSYINDAIILISNFVSSQKWAILELFSLDFFAVLIFFTSLFVISRFIMLKSKKKIVIVTCLIIIFFGFTVYASIPSNFNNFTIMQVGGNSNYSVIISPSGEKTIIGDFKKIENLQLFLKRAKINKIDYVIDSAESNSVIEVMNIRFFENEFNAKRIFFGENFKNNSMTINYLTPLAETNAILVKNYGYSCLFLTNELTTAEEENLHYILTNESLNFVFNAEFISENIGDYKIENNSLIYLEKSFKNLNNWAIKIKNGELKEMWSLN